MAEPHLQFGDFEFDTGSGELRRIDGGHDAEVLRLPPQPAALLTLLAEKKGGLVTREEICETIWPDAQVEFDAGLHFCIRQIRSALGDSAADGRYIETLPRRGYRLIPAVTLVAPAEAPPPTSWRQHSVVALAALAVVAAIVVVLVISGGKPVIRIGIMPFRPPDDTSWPGVVSPIAEWVLEDLATRLGSDVGIIGPTTTSAYQESDATMEQLADEYELDYLVNGRFIVTEGGARMFAELIRVSDGVHVWVKPYEDLSEGRRIGLEISANVARELGPSENGQAPARRGH